MFLFRTARLLWISLFLAACARGPETGEVQARDSVSATVIAQDVELFLERPESGEGEWILHLTRLSDSKPVSADFCEVAGVRGTAVSAGVVTLAGVPSDAPRVTCAVEGKTLNFDVAGIEDPAMPGAIGFLKEQQWTLDFRTGTPERRDLSESLRIPAELRARPGAMADVSSPLAGRVTISPAVTLGARLERGDLVASILPPTNAAGDLVSIQLARDDAQVALDLARRQLERAARLVEADAAPLRRLEEAKAAAEAAEARMRAANLRLEYYESSREADDREVGARRFLVRAPIAGSITEIFSQTGAYVETGAPLTRIVDTATLYVVGFVPEVDIPRLENVARAEVEFGDGITLAVRRFVSRGPVLDPQARTLPVTYEIANPEGKFAVNQAAHLRLALRGGRSALAVPQEALVDEGPQQVVFAQVSGESFARRVVRPGMRSGGWVEVTSGLEGHERIVTRGAYLVRLASLAGQLPTEGHVH
jgi:RND family efflux transporter MFP subunit